MIERTLFLHTLMAPVFDRARSSDRRSPVKQRSSAVCFLYCDHLGSTSLITNASGVTVSETRYQPYGQAYWQSGASQTDFGFTGQRMDGFGLMDYNARYYDPLLGRFISPDTIIPQPGSPLAWDRYAYTINNPINNIDPTGHMIDDGCRMSGCTGNPNATIHIMLIGSFPAVLRPNASTLSEKTENSYNPYGGKFAPNTMEKISDTLGLVNDILEQGILLKYLYDNFDISAHLEYQENKNGSINISAIDILNHSYTYVSLGIVNIDSKPVCNETCISVSNNYLVSPMSIGSKFNDGLGVANPMSYKRISLIPSNSNNMNNTFSPDSIITINAGFYDYMPYYDEAYEYRTLRYSFSW